MKKLFVLIMALVMTLSLAACGGGGDPAPNPDTSAPVTSGITLVSTKALNVALSIPSDFSEFFDNNGFAVTASEDKTGAISITPVAPTTDTLDTITVEYMIEIIGGRLSNIEVLAFENPLTIADNAAVFFQASGDTDTDGVNRTISYMVFFYQTEDQLYSQQIIFTYSTGANSSLEANLLDIIDSISLGN